MTSEDLINYMIPPLKPTESVAKVLSWMRELHLTELPVVAEGKFLGLISEQLILDSSTEKNAVLDFQLLGETLYVNANEHYYDLLKKSYEHNLSLVAVVIENGDYLGVVSVQDVVEVFSKMYSITSPGAIIVLNIEMINYSLSEISRIIETESGKILSSFVEEHPVDKSKIRLTLKLNTENAANIVSSLERFGYMVDLKYMLAEESDKNQERLDTLMRYLQI